MKYKKTLHMPQTYFSMRANLPLNEPKILDYWNRGGVYKKVLNKNKNNKKFNFLQGPPYANNKIHLGHALNMILKDTIIKWKWMNNFHAPFVLGWDTHGLPLERAVQNKIKNYHELSRNEFYVKAKEYAQEQINQQHEQFHQLGVLDDENYYATSSVEFINKQIELFNLVRQKGLVYRARKPIFWSYSSKTALADAEINYKDLESWSFYLTFKLCDNQILPQNTSLCIWTTTPWTLLVNKAVAINPQFEYVLVKNKNKHYVMGKDIAEQLITKFNFQDAKIIKTIKNEELHKLEYVAPFQEQKNPIIFSDHVTKDSGTMLVHVAPAHGTEDFALTRSYPDLLVENAIDEDGKVVITGNYHGMFYTKASDQIVSDLQEQNISLLAHKITHSYPVDWRSKKPVYYLASEQVFINLKPLAKNITSELEDVTFYPDWGKKRLNQMLTLRTDWCISRQRKYGVPILLFYDENKNIINHDDVYQSLLKKISSNTISAWYDLDINQLLDKDILKKYDTSKWTKETDIMDVWFDSGSVFYSGYDDNIEQYDLIIEGNDQYRGWFNSMMILSLIKNQTTPYKKVLVHAFILDEKNQKMSKSLNNVVDPIKIIKNYGADVLRLFFLSSEVSSDISFHNTFLNQTIEKYKKIRNTIRYILGNLNNVKSYDFLTYDQKESHIHFSNLELIDIYILNKLQKIHLEICKYYENFQFNKIVHTIMQFIINDLSAFYFDYAKDILYTQDPSLERVEQIKYTLFNILKVLLKILAPIIPFTCEDAYLNTNDFFLHHKYSLFLYDLELEPFINHQFDVNENLWNDFFNLKNNINQHFDQQQKAKELNTKQEMDITVFLAESDLAKNISLELLQEYLQVGSLKTTKSPQENKINEQVSWSFQKFNGLKCERCWKYFQAEKTKKYGSDILCLTCYNTVIKCDIDLKEE